MDIDANYISNQEIAQKSVDSVYATLSNDQRLELLTVFSAQPPISKTSHCIVPLFRVLIPQVNLDKS